MKNIQQIRRRREDVIGVAMIIFSVLMLIIWIFGEGYVR